MGRVIAIIPARAGSSRLPDKPLAELGGEPLICRVVRQVAACPLIDQVLVATDDERIASAVEACGGQVRFITEACDSGTVRVARAAQGLDATFVINVQGDQPFVQVEALARVVERLYAGAAVVTVAAPCTAAERALHHRVKVVRDVHGDALYFSRAPIPGDLHLGIYGFRADALSSLAALPRSPLAKAEDLEQLTWLEAGQRIAVVDATVATMTIDTPADLAAARAWLTEHP